MSVSGQVGGAPSANGNGNPITEHLTPRTARVAFP
jgi:hypothetical protein